MGADTIILALGRLGLEDLFKFGAHYLVYQLLFIALIKYVASNHLWKKGFVLA